MEAPQQLNYEKLHTKGLFIKSSKGSEFDTRGGNPPVYQKAVEHRRLLFQAQGEVDSMHDSNDDGLPGNQVPEPVKQLAIEHVGLLPAVVKELS